MKSRTMKILLLAFLTGTLIAQTKIDQPNYGYKLMPLSRLEEIKNFPEKYYKYKASAKSTLVPVVDYSNLMPPVLNQGGQGSCVAFALTYGLSFLNNQKSGYSLAHQYSQALIYNLSAVDQTSGMGIGQGLNILKDVGYVTSNLFPYNDQNWTTMPNLSVLETALSNRITADWDWFMVGDTGSFRFEGKPGYLGINTAKALLASGKVVILSFVLTEGYGSNMRSENWVYSYAAFGSWPFSGGHALCIVGYNDTLMTRDGRGAFKVINSWGVDKFDNGYSWITYKMLAEKSYDCRFVTFDLRDDYEPQLAITFDLNDFSRFDHTTSGIKTGSLVYFNQSTWSFHWGPNTPNFPKQMIIDLTDIVNGVQLSGKNTFFLEGSFYASKIGPNKPTIKGIRITDSVRGIDVYQSCNIVLRDSLFHVEWNFDKSVITGIEEVATTVPTQYELSQNYPNPFNPATTIRYSIPFVETQHAASQLVTLKVFNLLGREMAVLVDEEQPAGNYEVKFNSETLHATSLPSGVYFYKLSVGNYSNTKKMILVK